MLSGININLEIREYEIQQIRGEISSYIDTLHNKMNAGTGFFVSQTDIDVWQEKKNVLDVALSVLSAEKSFADLEIAMNNNPRYKDGLTSKTKPLVDSVIRIMTVADKPELSLSCVANIAPAPLPSVNHPELSNLFIMLPDDIMLLLLVGYLHNTADILSVATTSRHCHSLFKQNYSLIMLHHLLDHAALGEWDAARKIWSRNKGILELKGTVYHPDRYLYENLTAFQIACKNEENDIIEEMKLILSAEEYQKQLNEISSDGELKIEYDLDLEVAKGLLQDVYAAIILDDVIKENNMELMSSDTREALQALFDYLSPEKYNKCQKGLVFDVRIWQQALQTYEDNINAFGDLDRCTFWCIRVEEAIASHLSTGYLRPHCQGIYNIVERGEKLKGGGCKLSDGSSYFPFLRQPNSLPGVHFFVNIFGARRTWQARAKRWLDVGPLEKLCRAKTSNLQNLCSQTQKRLSV